MASPSPDSTSRPAGAIFLSYAREDTDAAKRIADALRAFGVEVWFDQSELRGGDQWDTKIKKQIRECALFLPIVSATTQTRNEGYFRREWLLAAERTRDMATGVAFIVPIVTDDTLEAEASVPEEFMRYQWTRLAHGVPSPQFVEQIKHLLKSPRKAAPVSRATGAPASGSPYQKSFPAWVWGMLATVAVGGVVAFVIMRPVSKPAAETKTIATAASPASEARQLTEKAKTLQDEFAIDGTLRGNLTLAEQLCKRAVELDPLYGDAWAISARVCLSLRFGDANPVRLEQAREYAQRAVQLSPDSVEARLAMADYYRQQTATRPEGVRILRELVQRAPAEKRVLRMMGLMLGTTRPDEALVYYQRAAALPGGDSKALLSISQIHFSAQRYAEAEATVNESLAVRPTAAAQLFKIRYVMWRGELAEARAILDKVPASALQDDQGVYLGSLLLLWQQEAEKGLTLLRASPRDYFEDGWSMRGPKGYFTGLFDQALNKPDAARAEWRAALGLVNGRLASQPNDALLLSWRALLLGSLGEREEAERAFRLADQLGLRAPGTGYAVDFFAAQILAVMGRTDEAIQRLQPLIQQAPTPFYRTSLRFDPVWLPLRSDPRFEALVKAPEKK